MDDDMGTIRRRAHTNTTTEDGAEVLLLQDGGGVSPGKDSTKSGNDEASGQRTTWMLILFSVIVLLALLVARTLDFLSRIRFLQCLTLFPVLICFWRGITNRGWRNRILPLTVVATTVFAQLPVFLGSGFSALCIVALSMNTIPSSRNHRLKGSPIPVFFAVIILVSVMLTENFMIWVVSATFEPGQRRDTAPPPLQDNGRTVIRSFASGLNKREVVGLRRLWNVQGALAGCLGSSLALSELYGVRHLYRLACRATLTMAAARFVRTMSFLATVLPSQNQSCYAERFPYPPPTDWKEWIWVGLMPAAHGGCNDLIISGHATVTATFTCMAASMSGDAIFSAALWSLLALDYMVEVYEGFHYTVDMFLGAVLVCLFWRVLQPLEGDPPCADDISKQSTMVSPTSNEMMLSRNATMVLYCTPALLGYLQLILFPPWTANFLIVFYTASAAVLFLALLKTKDRAHSAWITHVGQHILFCVLYVALGVYL